MVFSSLNVCRIGVFEGTFLVEKRSALPFRASSPTARRRSCTDAARSGAYEKSPSQSDPNSCYSRQMFRGRSGGSRALRGFFVTDSVQWESRTFTYLWSSDSAIHPMFAPGNYPAQKSAYQTKKLATFGTTRVDYVAFNVRFPTAV